MAFVKGNTVHVSNRALLTRTGCCQDDAPDYNGGGPKSVDVIRSTANKYKVIVFDVDSKSVGGCLCATCTNNECRECNQKTPMEIVKREGL
jgi:hypothetical protein